MIAHSGGVAVVYNGVVTACYTAAGLCGAVIACNEAVITCTGMMLACHEVVIAGTRVVVYLNGVSRGRLRRRCDCPRRVRDRIQRSRGCLQQGQ